MQQNSQRMTGLGKLVVVGVMLALAGGGFYLMRRPAGGRQEAHPGGAEKPSRSAQRPSGSGVAVPVLYERSLEKSLSAAAEQFNKANHGTYEVVLTPMASRQGMKSILYENAQAALWIPADELWPAKLAKAWRDPKLGKDAAQQVVRETEVLFTTPIVLAAWPDRAQALRRAMASGKYSGQTWRLLADLARNGWSSIGEPSAWGRLKMVHSHPLESNSAASMLVLNFLELAQSQPGVGPYDAATIGRMKALYSGVVALPETTGKALDEFLTRGPSRVDLVVCYEANALKAMRAGRQGFQVVYPEPTTEARLPGAVLVANGVSPEAAQGAHEFLTFLRSAEGQALATEDGVRPTRPEQTAAAEQALTAGAFGEARFQATPLFIERAPGASTVDSLVDAWNQQVASPDDRRQ